MPAKKRATKRVWRDPDDAPEWTKEQFDRAEVARGDEVVSQCAWNPDAPTRPTQKS